MVSARTTPGWRDLMAMCFRRRPCSPWRTVLANVILPLHIQGRPRAEAKTIALQHLARVGLTGFEGKYPWQLSGGMQQRVSIARALSFEPSILMMDEPFGALDEITRDRLNEQLQQLWQRERRTVVFVTHSISEAVYLATRIVVMSPRRGRIAKVIESPLPDERHLGLARFCGVRRTWRTRCERHWRMGTMTDSPYADNGWPSSGTRALPVVVVMAVVLLAWYLALRGR